MLTSNNIGASVIPMPGAALPRIVLPDGRRVDAPHPEWQAHQLRWRWLLDSWEGGEAYRTAVYGYDPRGMPVRNLVRHKREYPASPDGGAYPPNGRPFGTDPAHQATDDDYELRRARTPVPTFVSEAVEAHLARIFSREVKRQGSERLEGWWRDVDGRGTTIDEFMANSVAPLLLVLGQLDLMVDRPAAPEGEAVRNRADEIRLGLDRAVASYILPENMLWWRLDRAGRYLECLVREVDEGGVAYRYWNEGEWTLYDARGEVARGPVEHGHGQVPIVRVFDRRRPRCTNIGLPRYESIAEIQREFYNRDSELILSDTTQAHPLLQGPEDYVKADGAVPIGPNWLLPKKKNSQGGSTTYEGFDVVEFPKAGAESLRLNKADLRDAADRAALLLKPAGAAGTGGSTVGQSGVSKRLDQAAGNDLLSKVAATLAQAERRLADLAGAVLSATPSEEDREPVRVQYPTTFDLFTGEELARTVGQFQAILAAAGHAPRTESEMLGKLVRVMLPGLDDHDYAAFDAEIDAYLGLDAGAGRGAP